MNKLPEIRIKDAWLLRKNASAPLNEFWGDGTPLRSDDEYASIVEAYKKAWKPNQDKILTAMTRTLELSFRQNIVDVYIAPWFHAFSDPMVIGVVFEPDDFVDTLTHELIHRLLTDNTTLLSDKPLLAEWQKLFGKSHNFDTTIHIPVHAVHEAIYLDVLKAPKRLERDIARTKEVGAKDYIASWDYVDEHGYKEIIAQLKKSYQEMSA